MHNSSTHDSDDDGSQLLPWQLPLGEPPPLLMLLYYCHHLIIGHVELALINIVKKKQKQKQKKDKKIKKIKERRMGPLWQKLGPFPQWFFFSSPLLHITNCKVQAYLVQLWKDLFLPKSNQKHPIVATPTHHKLRTNKNKTNLGYAMLKTKLVTKHLLQLEKQQK